MSGLLDDGPGFLDRETHGSREPSRAGGSACREISLIQAEPADLILLSGCPTRPRRGRIRLAYRVRPTRGMKRPAARLRPAAKLGKVSTFFPSTDSTLSLGARKPRLGSRAISHSNEEIRASGSPCHTLTITGARKREQAERRSLWRAGNDKGPARETVAARFRTGFDLRNDAAPFKAAWRPGPPGPDARASWRLP